MKHVVPVLAILVAISGTAWGQLAGAYDPVGVYLDNEGVLNSRTTKPDSRLKELRKGAKKFEKDRKLVYVSLKRIFAEAKKLQEAGKPLPDRIRFLDGMTKLRYIFVYPEDGDIIIAGDAEPFDPRHAFRPLGQRTGRPVLHFDDLVTALRAFASGKKPDRLGCDIQITADIANRINKTSSKVVPKAQFTGPKKAAEAIAAAGGNQPVKFYGIDPDTRFAFVCVEADYRLKQLALGLLKSPTRKMKSYTKLMRKPEKPHRFSLETKYDDLLVTPDGNAFEIRGQALRINTGVLFAKGKARDDISQAARTFMELGTTHFETLAKDMVSWADLANLSDLSLASALIGSELQARTKLDLAWILGSYKQIEIKAPRSARTLCNYHHAGRMLLFTSGGVWLNPAKHAEARTEDGKGLLNDMPLQPHGDEWSILRKVK